MIEIIWESENWIIESDASLSLGYFKLDFGNKEAVFLFKQKYCMIFPTLIELAEIIFSQDTDEKHRLVGFDSDAFIEIQKLGEKLAFIVGGESYSCSILLFSNSIKNLIQKLYFLSIETNPFILQEAYFEDFKGMISEFGLFETS